MSIIKWRAEKYINIKTDILQEILLDKKKKMRLTHLALTLSAVLVASSVYVSAERPFIPEPEVLAQDEGFFQSAELEGNAILCFYETRLNLAYPLIL